MVGAGIFALLAPTASILALSGARVSQPGMMRRLGSTVGELINPILADGVAGWLRAMAATFL